MLTERFPSVSAEEVEAGIPSGSIIGIDKTNVLEPIRCPCRRGSGGSAHSRSRVAGNG